MMIRSKRKGGATGIPHMGTLESALYRPQTGYYKDLLEEAACRNISR
jgi:death-on-curing protein